MRTRNFKLDLFAFVLTLALRMLVVTVYLILKSQSCLLNLSAFFFIFFHFIYFFFFFSREYTANTSILKSLFLVFFQTSVWMINIPPGLICQHVCWRMVCSRVCRDLIFRSSARGKEILRVVFFHETWEPAWVFFSFRSHAVAAKKCTKK